MFIKLIKAAQKVYEGYGKMIEGIHIETKHGDKSFDDDEDK